MINRWLYVVIMLTVVWTITACKPLMQYSISEQEINKYLQQHNNYEKKIGIPGLVDAQITLSQLQSQIGRTVSDKIQLTGNAKVAITSLLGLQNADITLTLIAKPQFDRDKGAIFLKDLALTDYTVKPEEMDAVMKMLTPYLNQSLKSYFNQYPAYVLNADNSIVEMLAQKLAKGLEIKPGQLVIPFKD